MKTYENLIENKLEEASVIQAPENCYMLIATVWGRVYSDS